MMKLRTGLMIGAAVATSVLIGGCSWVKSMTSESSEGPLRISRSPWAPFDLLQVGIDKRLAGTDPAQFRLLHFSELFDSRRAFESRNADVTLMTPYEILLAKETGEDPVIFMTTDISEGADGIVTQSYVNGLKDLKEKKVGVEVGTISHFFLVKGLKSVGLREVDVTIVNMGYSDFEDAFARKKVDAVVTWNPLVDDLVQKHRGKIVFNSSSIPSSIITVAAVHRDSYKSRKNELRKLTETWFASVEFYNRDVSTALEMMGKLQNTTPRSIAQQMNGVRLLSREQTKRKFRMSSGSSELIHGIEELQEFLFEKGLVKSRQNIRDMVTNEIVESAK